MHKIIALAITALMLTNVAAQAHGGGCRKNSPPGQCCHEEKRTGLVHCH